MKLKHIPNTITALRLAFVPLLCAFILQGRMAWALACAILMFVTDGLDGFLARRFDWHSRFGTFFDPLADKLTILAAFLSFAYAGYIAWWFSIAVLLITGLLLIGGIILYFKATDIDVSPSMISKVNTLLQFVLIILILANGASLLEMPQYFETLKDGLMWLILLTMTWSLVTYFKYYKYISNTL